MPREGKANVLTEVNSNDCQLLQKTHNFRKEIWRLFIAHLVWG